MTHPELLYTAYVGLCVWTFSFLCAAYLSVQRVAERIARPRTCEVEVPS